MRRWGGREAKFPRSRSERVAPRAVGTLRTNTSNGRNIMRCSFTGLTASLAVGAMLAIASATPSLAQFRGHAGAGGHAGGFADSPSTFGGVGHVGGFAGHRFAGSGHHGFGGAAAGLAAGAIVGGALANGYGYGYGWIRPILMITATIMVKIMRSSIRVMLRRSRLTRPEGASPIANRPIGPTTRRAGPISAMTACGIPARNDFEP